MKKSKISLYFIFVSLFTFIAIFFTIVQNSYNNLMKPIKEAQNDIYLQPINPILETEIVDEIQKRSQYIDQSNLNFNSSTTSSTLKSPSFEEDLDQTN